MMMTGPLLAWILVVQHFTLEVQNLFAKAATFSSVFRLLLVMSFVTGTHDNIQGNHILELLPGFPVG